MEILFLVAGKLFVYFIGIASLLHDILTQLHISMFSFVKVSRLPSRHETKSQVSCSFRVSENKAHRIDATAENIFTATKDHVLKATDAINRGEVIAVPTDTIYGFACDAWLVFSSFL